MLTMMLTIMIILCCNTVDDDDNGDDDDTDNSEDDLNNDVNDDVDKNCCFDPDSDHNSVTQWDKPHPTHKHNPCLNNLHTLGPDQPSAGWA